MKIPASLAVAGAIGLAAAITLGAGCTGIAPAKTDAASPTQATKQAAIANPAATKCSNEKLGYRTGEDAAGQYGVCIFDDKSECEEWAYFRGECEKGDCAKWEGCPKMKPGGK